MHCGKNGESDPDAVWHHRLDGSRDEAGSVVWGSVHGGVLFGANLRRAIVTNGNFTAYVCDGAATRASSQITLGRLDYYDYDYYYCYIVVKFAECTNLSKRGNLDVSCGVICVARFIFRNVDI